MAWVFMISLPDHNLYKVAKSKVPVDDYVNKYFPGFNVELIWSKQLEDTLATQFKNKYIELAKDKQVSMLSVDIFTGEPPDHDYVILERVVISKAAKPEEINDCPF
jgi:hypothetical protein